MRPALEDACVIPDWKHCPTGVGFYRFHKERFAAFLDRNGVTVGVPPRLPAGCVEVPEPEFDRNIRHGFDKWTYFARGCWTGRIKIGQSNNPSQRVRDLIHSNFGEEAELVATLRGSHFERAYHDVFREWLDGHEWFAPHPDILAEIDRINAEAVA